MMVLRQLFTMMTKGTDVNYSTGNHDEVLRKISALQPRNTLFSCLQPTNTDPSSRINFLRLSGTSSLRIAAKNKPTGMFLYNLWRTVRPLNACLKAGQ